MKSKTLFFILVIIISLFNSGCKPIPEKKSEVQVQNNLLYAVLYNTYAAEYKALCYQAYSLAGERLLELKKTNPQKTNMAVVLDLDETVLDNSPYEAWFVLNNQIYTDSTWNEWCALASAPAVPGAAEFLHYADSLGFSIFYISNRKDKYTHEGTVLNLQKLNLPQAEEDHIFLRKGSRDKEDRRQIVSENHEIVLLIGDNLIDFYTDIIDFGPRQELMMENKNNFGKKFIVLPNPMYGDWVKSLNFSDSQTQVDSLLQEIVNHYYSKIN